MLEPYVPVCSYLAVRPVLDGEPIHDTSNAALIAQVLKEHGISDFIAEGSVYMDIFVLAAFAPSRAPIFNTIRDS
jgi:hypothetical protein